jgi:uncharacterized protein
MDKNLALTVLSAWSPWGSRLASGIKRPLYLDQIIKNLETNIIKVFVGFRRSGKSYLMRQLIDYLLNEKQINPNNICYLNLEDDRLNNNLDLTSLRFIFETYEQSIRPQGKIYFLLDEIQLIDNFEKFLRTLYELKNKDIEIFITGSNSQLLSSEISSSLSGRFLEFTVFPLNFSEFLLFKGMLINNQKSYIKHQSDIKMYFEEFLEFGGLPEIIFLPQAEQKINYLRGVLAKIVLDDIVKRFKIREINNFEKTMNFILSGTSNIINAAKIAKHIYGNKTGLAQEHLISKYINYAKQAFLFFELEKFNWKLSRIFETSKKYYTLDLGIRETCKSNLDNDYSRKLENLVFLKLKQSQVKFFYGMDNNNKEIDFLVDNNNVFDKYQISANLNKENQRRELNNFVLANKYLDKGKNFILTLNAEESTIKYKNQFIQQKNIINFLLDL